tara:strand:+ start:807 stop:1115 length:309 start_codon:yes stop_codon:yes gene_type:complete
MNNFLSLLNLNFLLNDDSFKNWRIIIFISILALIMIYSGHSAENKIFKIAELNENINELKNEFIDKRSQLIQLKMESKISLKLRHLDLEPADKPPIKIIIEN